MATFNYKYYVELPLGGWEYRRKRMQPDPVYSTIPYDKNHNYFRYKCGSRTTSEILQTLCDYTVNAEWRDVNEAPLDIRAQHTFPVPKFTVAAPFGCANSDLTCTAFLKKKMYVEGKKEYMYNEHIQISGDDYLYIVPTYPYATETWYEDLINSTHDVDGHQKSSEECMNSRMMREKGSDILSMLSTNHGGHLKLVYPEWQSLKEVPKPYLVWKETYSEAPRIEDFEDIQFGVRTFTSPPQAKAHSYFRTNLVTDLGSAYNTKDYYEVCFTAFNPYAWLYYELSDDTLDHKFNTGGSVVAMRSDMFDRKDIGKTPTLEHTIHTIINYYNWHIRHVLPCASQDESYPLTPENIVPYWHKYYSVDDIIWPSDTDQWNSIKDTVCDLFIGDIDHCLNDVVNYICEKFNLRIESYDVDNKTKSLKVEFGYICDNSISTIDFGINLLDYTKDMDVSDVVTAVVPYMINFSSDKDTDSGRTFMSPGAKWHGVYIPEAEYKKDTKGDVFRSKYVYNEELVNTYGWVTDIVEFDYQNYDYISRYVTEADQERVVIRNLLKSLGNEYLYSQFNKTIETFELSAVDMAYFTGTKRNWKIGDMVHCKSDPHGFNKILPITKIELDLADPSNNIYTLGNANVKSLSRWVGERTNKTR